MSKSYLLRVEAINLDNFVYDTNKIQPTRGGSFLLLESVQKLAPEDSKTKSPQTFGGVTLEKITTGASIGLFRFKDEGGIVPERVANEVLAELKGTTGGHATFVVDFLEETGDFKNDLLLLNAKNRWRQYQQPTLILPNINNTAQKECVFDGVRPGVVQVNFHEEGKSFLSNSVAFRINAAEKDLRDKIYSRILGKDIPDKFTDDLEELSFHNKKGNLNNKIAFIYFDGNKFGKIRTELCDESRKMTHFSKIVENSRSAFLSALLDKAKEDNDFMTNGKIRIETLLWGGDELEIIVPAWKGWDVIQLFFETMKNTYYEDEEKGKEKVPLTHAGGIVFCNHKAPIREIRRMAHELAEMTKEEIKSDFVSIETIKNNVNHEKHDTFRFLTLESFDTVGGQVKTFAQTYFGKTIWKNMRIEARILDKLDSAISTMKTNGFPRNKIFDIVNRIKTGEEEKDQALKEGKEISFITQMEKTHIESFKEFIGEILVGIQNEKRETIEKAINDFVEEQIERWFVICDLWDYVGGEQ